VFHLLTAATETSAFPMRRRPSHETNDVRPSAASEALPANIGVGDSRPLLSIAASTGESRFGRPLLCCGFFAVALMFVAAGAGRAYGQNAKPSSRADRIANALTAAPEEITRNATVRDWPSKEGEEPAVLRQGTNGWTCLPDDPTTPGNDPTCIDATFFDAVAAFFAGQAPKITRVGYGYMLTSDAEGSNTDPTATAATATNQWHHAGPHVMLIYPDAKLLDGVPTKPTASGPYVMFPGTPIAHVMLPVASGYARSHSSAQKTAARP
jgi:hypothetical protein